MDGGIRTMSGVAPRNFKGARDQTRGYANARETIRAFTLVPRVSFAAAVAAAAANQISGV
jgi:hypothetical protein